MALIIVDIQNDFLPGGPLAVPDGDAIIPKVNALMDKFDLILATKDWHPQGHASFEIWPPHCVQGTRGAEFPSSLRAEKIERVFLKGVDPFVDSYSGFYDNEKIHSTGLAEFLKERGIKEVTVVGFATDFCIKHTVLDALSLGFKTFIIADCCKPITEEGGKKALLEMEEKGAIIL